MRRAKCNERTQAGPRYKVSRTLVPSYITASQREERGGSAASKKNTVVI